MSIGDKVKLKSGGPVMLVVEIEGGIIVCGWPRRIGGVTEAAWPAECLVPIDKK